jgi:hypothetical protein
MVRLGGQDFYGQGFRNRQAVRAQLKACAGYRHHAAGVLPLGPTLCG